jgi:hypothetical protein
MDNKPTRSKWCYDKNRSVFNTFEVLHNKLVDEDNNAEKIVTLASFLETGEIPTSYFANTTTFGGSISNPGQGKTLEVIGTANLAWELASWFEDLVGDEVAFRLAVARLEEWCLVRVRKNVQGLAVSFAVHNAVRRWGFERMQKQDLRLWILFAASVVGRFLPDIGSRISAPLPGPASTKPSTTVSQ